jgi:hypothetical protein
VDSPEPGAGTVDSDRVRADGVDGVDGVEAFDEECGVDE